MEKNQNKPKIIAIVGTTASGKSDLGIFLAQKFNGEVVSCDSRQVYKGLDLGSGKVTKEEQQQAVHHMLDVVYPGQKYSVADFQNYAYKCIDDILSRGRLPILVGGTGLYVRAITDGYNFVNIKPNEQLRKELENLSREELIKKAIFLGEDKTEAQKLSPAHLIRRIEKLSANGKKTENNPKYNVLKIGLTYPKDVLAQRIKQRIDNRLPLGMIEEVKGLLESGISQEFLDGLGLEYRYISRYLTGKISYNEFYESLQKDTKAFAKRQMTWFKKDNPIWLDTSKNVNAQAEKLAKEFLSK